MLLTKPESTTLKTLHNGTLRTVGLAVSLCSFLFLMYLLTFSGMSISDDTRLIYDTVESIAVHGNWLQNQTAYLGGVQTSTVEPAQPLLTVPLFLLAYNLSWVGNIHAVYLFTSIVTAIAGGLLFIYARELGYSERLAIIAAALFGLTTIVWTYTQTYFREPLTMMMLLLTTLLWHKWRKSFTAGNRYHWIVLSTAIIATVVAILTKEAALLSLPLFMLVAFPDVAPSKKIKNWLLWAGLIAVITMIAFWGVITLMQSNAALYGRYQFLPRLDMLLNNYAYTPRGLIGYLISPGKGIWWFSPILLLSLYSPFVKPRRRGREAWLWLGFAFLFVLLYAAIRGELWFGGKGWGARYMLPIVPFLMLAGLPTLDYLLKLPKHWGKLIIAVLGVWGFLVQVGGAYVDISAYDTYLVTETGDFPWIGKGLWSFRWSQPIGAWFFLPHAVPDILWLRDPIDWLTLIVIVLGIALSCAGIFWHYKKKENSVFKLISILTLPLVVVGITSLAMYRAYDDPRYRGGQADLADMMSFLHEHVQHDDPILVPTSYNNYFANYYKGEGIWYGMEYIPGEKYLVDQVPDVVSDDLIQLMGERNAYIIQLLQAWGGYHQEKPVWFVSDISPWVEWAVLPVEHYIAQRHYIVFTQDFSPQVRLVQYLPMIAPGTEQEPAIDAQVNFGGDMLLVGVDIVDSGHHTLEEDDIVAGERISVSLLWQAEQDIDTAFTVSIHLIAPDGQSFMQVDRQPVDGFSPTNTWLTGDRYRDNYGFVLPEELAPGQYQIWLIVYTQPDIIPQTVVDADDNVLGEYFVLSTFEVK